MINNNIKFFYIINMMYDIIILYYPFALISFVMCCCWFDRYFLKRYCERNGVVFDRENEIENEIEIEMESDAENEIYSDTESEEYSDTEIEEYSETDSENSLVVKPDYDEDTEDEYGRPLALG